MTAVMSPNAVEEELVSSTDPLKIVLASWAPFHAGAEVAAERLALALHERGHEVTVVLGTEGVTFQRMQAANLDVRFIRLAFTDKLKWWRYYRAQQALRRLLLEWQPDVVHANDLPTSQMIGQAAARLGIPRICHHRWIFGDAAIDWFNKFGAERHVFVSHALMNELCRNSPQLAKSSGVVVHDGLPLPADPTDADRDAVRRRLSLSQDGLLVLFAGQVIERKGVEDLLRAWMLLPPRVSARADLVFVGDDLENHGVYRRRMEALAAKLNCPARFEGFQRNVNDWIVAADVCVVPSHAEPLGNATLEAMAHGRPAIGSNVGGIPEMIVDRVTGLLVPPRDPQRLAAAINELLSDAELRHRLGQAGRQRCAEKFSLRAHVDAVVREYRQVVAKRDRVTA